MSDHDYVSPLIEAGAKCGRATAELRQAEAEREIAIRHAATHGGMTLREISGHVGISFQRVAQILKD